MIQFQDSFWLWLLPVVLPLLLCLIVRTSRARSRLLARFASQNLIHGLTSSFSHLRQKWKYGLILAALSLLVLALARPQWGSEWQEARGKGIDILFVVDASNSMLARDIAPNRLARAKLAILDLIEDLEGDRLGLVAFSGNAFLQCPLTLDYDAFRQSLDVVEPGLLSQGGTDFGAAIEEAAATFETGDNFKFIVLITDGEDLAGNALAQAREAAQQNIKVFTVGVGSPEGERIPVYDNRGRPTYLRDDRGNFVLTRLDEKTLQEVAEITGGFYVPLGAAGQGLQAVLNEGLANVPREELGSRLERIPVERFQLFLLLGILLLVLESLFGNRRKPPPPNGSPTSSKTRNLSQTPDLFKGPRPPDHSKISNLKTNTRNQKRKTNNQKIRAPREPLKAQRAAWGKKTSLSIKHLPLSIPPTAIPKPATRNPSKTLSLVEGKLATRHPKRATRYTLLATFSLLLPFAASAQTNRQALQLFSESNYDAAEREFQQFTEKDPDNLLHQFNTGCVAFRKGELQRAARIFRQVLETTDLDLQADTFYNLGNTQFRLGQETRQTNPEATIAAWEDALIQYQNTMELRPEDTNAAYNYRVVKELLDQLKEQQEQQQQNQDQQEQNQDQNQEQEESQDQQNQQQDSSDQNQQQQDSNSQQQDSSRDQPQSQPQDPSDSEADGSEPQNQPPPPSEREITSGDTSGEESAQPESGETQPAQSIPLQMTPQEAEQLLEALRQTEKKLPVTGYGDEEQPRNPENLKDW